MLNVPNFLTIIRLILVPVFIVVFFSTISNNLIYSIIIFLVAGFTDILDGYIARKYNLITEWGMVLDPLADKLMLLTVLTCLTIYNYVPIWVLLIVSVKEIFMIIFGMLLYKKKTVIPSNVFGKISTTLFYLSIVLFCFDKDFATIFLYIAVISAFVAFMNYLLIYKKGTA